jgi:taurine--2-oxoglutarate transaminase
MKHGTFMNSWINYLIIAPPLIITQKEIDEGLRALDKGLQIADKEIS